MKTADAAIADQKTSQQTEETGLEYVASLCGMFAVLLFTFTFVFQNFEVPSGSMEKTILTGDHIFVDRETFAPPTRWAPFDHHRDVRRGDIIVFLKPGEPNLTLVKRVVGLPGDHIHLLRGVVYINGTPQNEPQAGMPTDLDYERYRDDFPSGSVDEAYGLTASWAVELPTHIVDGELVVPPGKYFAMGDNRLYSLDSRFWGFVPRENILGRPLFVYWSFITPENQQYKTSMADRTAFTLHTVLHFFDQTRWRRTLHILR